MSIITIYKEPIIVEIVRIKPGVPNRNLPMTRNNFVVFKGVTTKVDFQVRDNNRRKENLIGKTLMISVYDSTTDTTILEKPLKIRDPYDGVATLQIDPPDISTARAKLYEYSVTMQDEEGIVEPLYTGLNQKATGFFEVSDATVVQAKPALEINTDYEKMTPVPVRDYGQSLNEAQKAPSYRFHTEPKKGDSQSPKPDAFHTIAIYNDNFLGRIYIQGSLTNAPSVDDESQWVNLELDGQLYIEITQKKTEVIVSNFVANLMWVRAIIEPLQSLKNSSGDWTGRITKILLKN